MKWIIILVKLISNLRFIWISVALLVFILFSFILKTHHTTSRVTLIIFICKSPLILFWFLFLFLFTLLIGSLIVFSRDTVAGCNIIIIIIHLHFLISWIWLHSLISFALIKITIFVYNTSLSYYCFSTFIALLHFNSCLPIHPLLCLISRITFASPLRFQFRNTHFRILLLIFLFFLWLLSCPLGIKILWLLPWDAVSCVDFWIT